MTDLSYMDKTEVLEVFIWSCDQCGQASLPLIFPTFGERMRQYGCTGKKTMTDNLAYGWTEEEFMDHSGNLGTGHDRRSARAGKDYKMSTDYPAARDLIISNLDVLLSTLREHQDEPHTVRELAKMIEDNAHELRRVSEESQFSHAASLLTFTSVTIPGGTAAGYNLNRVTRR